MLSRVTIGSLFMVLWIVVSIHQGYAQTEPRGWRCEYRIDDGTRQSPRIFNCYGRNLNETRARAQARCRGNPYCNAGACLPLDRTPGNSCQ